MRPAIDVMSDKVKTGVRSKNNLLALKSMNKAQASSRSHVSSFLLVWFMNLYLPLRFSRSLHLCVCVLAC